MPIKKLTKAKCARCGEEYSIPSSAYFEYVLIRQMEFVCHDCREEGEANFV